MAQPMQIDDIDNAKVHVGEGSAAAKFDLAKIEHLGTTVTLYAWLPEELTQAQVDDGVVPKYRWVRIDTLRRAQARPAAGGHIEIEGVSDEARTHGILEAEAVVEWRVWPGKGRRPEAA